MQDPDLQPVVPSSDRMVTQHRGRKVLARTVASEDGRDFRHLTSKSEEAQSRKDDSLSSFIPSFSLSLFCAFIDQRVAADEDEVDLRSFT